MSTSNRSADTEHQRVDIERADVDCLKQWDKDHVWHAFTQMAEYEPLIIESAQGAWLKTVDGQRLLDGASSLWCNVLGHRHPRLDAAISDQLGKVAHVTNLGVSNPTTIRLAVKLLQVAPASLECVFFSGDGASAVEVALKMVVQFWRQNSQPQRRRFIALGGAYHGDTVGCVSVGGIARLRDPFDSMLFDVIHGPCPDAFRLPNGVQPEQACAHYVDEYRKLLDKHAGEIAAVIVEPLMQCAAGMVQQPAGFISGLRQLTADRDILLIVDEIAVGMGRSGKMWACQWENVEPDLMCIGKGLSGGYMPMAATLTSRRVWDAFLGTHQESRAFLHGHTYGGNPLGAAVSLATLQIFEDERTLDRVLELSKALAECLRALSDHPHVGNIRICGLIAAIDLVGSRLPRQEFASIDRRGVAVCDVARQHGVWLRPLGNIVPLVPPLCISPAEIKLLVDAVSHGIEAATN